MKQIVRISLFLALIGLFSNIYVSCIVPSTSRDSLGSQSRDNNDRDDRDEDDDGRSRRSSSSRACHERDSCEDICDDIFKYASERLECAELSFSEIGNISVVDDIVTDRRISKSELEDDLDLEDFSLYLDLGFDSFVSLLEGEEVGEDDTKWNQTARKDNSRVLLEWIAENDDVARIMLDKDTNFTVATQLFINIAPGKSLNDLNNKTEAEFSRAELTIKGSSSPTRNPRTIDIEDSHFHEFVTGFSNIDSKFDNSQFMIFASDEGNAEAFEWGHNALVESCAEAVDEDIDEVETKQCVLAAYCAFPDDDSGDDNQERIFEQLSDEEDIVGRVRNNGDCVRTRMIDEDRVEDLFE